MKKKNTGPRRLLAAIPSYRYHVVYQFEGKHSMGTGTMQITRVSPLSNSEAINETANYIKQVNHITGNLILTNWILL